MARRVLARVWLIGAALVFAHCGVDGRSERSPPEVLPAGLASPVSLRAFVCANEAALGALDADVVAPASGAVPFEAVGPSGPVQLRALATAHFDFVADQGVDDTALGCAAASAETAWDFLLQTLGPFRDDAQRVRIHLFRGSPPEVIRAVAGRYDERYGGAFVAPATVVFYNYGERFYLHALATFTHELTHRAQHLLRQSDAGFLFVEGEAEMMAALASDATIPGASSRIFDADLRRIADAFATGATASDLIFETAPHELHDEVTLFALAAEGTTTADWTWVGVRSPPELLETGREVLVKRPGFDPERLSAVTDAESVRRRVKRPRLAATLPTVVATLSRDDAYARPGPTSWCAGITVRGFRPHDLLMATLGTSTTFLRLDGRGAGSAVQCVFAADGTLPSGELLVSDGVLELATPLHVR